MFTHSRGCVLIDPNEKSKSNLTYNQRLERVGCTRAHCGIVSSHVLRVWNSDFPCMSVFVPTKFTSSFKYQIAGMGVVILFKSSLPKKFHFSLASRISKLCHPLK